MAVRADTAAAQDGLTTQLIYRSHARQVKDAVARLPGLRLEIVKRSDDTKGFVVLPRRWVVERTFSWFGRNRRLAKDYENLAETLAAFITLAAIQFAIRRLARA
jgi:transposase